MSVHDAHFPTSNVSDWSSCSRQRHSWSHAVNNASLNSCTSSLAAGILTDPSLNMLIECEFASGVCLQSFKKVPDLELIPQPLCKLWIWTTQLNRHLLLQLKPGRSLLHLSRFNEACSFCRMGRSFLSYCLACLRQSWGSLYRRWLQDLCTNICRPCNLAASIDLRPDSIVAICKYANMQTDLWSMQVLKSLVPDLFRGSYAYETICKASWDSSI